MDILFQNSYTRDKSLAKEIYRYYYFQRKLYVCLYIMLGIALLLQLLGAFLWQSYNAIVFIAVPLVILVNLLCYFSQVNAMINRDKELYGQEIKVETVVTNEFIQNTTSVGSVNKLDFKNIRNAVQTKNLILLRSKANLVYIFEKDAFTIGNKEDFIIFLKNKGIKVKGK